MNNFRFPGKARERARKGEESRPHVGTSRDTPSRSYIIACQKSLFSFQLHRMYADRFVSPQALIPWVQGALFLLSAFLLCPSQAQAYSAAQPTLYTNPTTNNNVSDMPGFLLSVCFLPPKRLPPHSKTSSTIPFTPLSIGPPSRKRLAHWIATAS